MKRILNICLLLALFLLAVQPAQGQRLLKKIGDKALKKAEQRFEKKADEKVDKELDKVEAKLEKELAEDSTSTDGTFDLQDAMKGLGIAGEPVATANNYDFDHLIQMHIESYDENGNKTDDSEFVTHFNSNSKSVAYQVLSGNMAENTQGLFIMDLDNEAMIMLSDEKGEKKGIVYGIRGFMNSIGETYEDVELEDSPETYMANPNVKKTGKTKNIAGYKCEEFLYSDETSESNIWVTKDVKLNTKDFFSTIFKTSMYSHGMGWGYMMEATTTDKETGRKSLMQVTKIDKNSGTNFTLADYEITNLGSFQTAGNE